MKMFYQKLPKKWNNFFYVPPPFLGSWCHQLHFLRKDWNPVSLPGRQVQPVTPLVAAWMASSCLAFGLPFPNHKSKPIQSFAWIIFHIPTKCITSNLWQNFSLTHFIVQISEFSELPKNKFSPLVQQWHSESLRQKRFYLELDLWGKYSWYIERNTVDTLREIQLKHSGKYSWYRGRSDCILRWDLCGSGQARISCITDRCSQRYALVNLGLQLYLAWSLFVCPPHLLVGLLLPRLRNTRYMKTKPCGDLAPRLVNK